MLRDSTLFAAKSDQLRIDNGAYTPAQLTYFSLQFESGNHKRQLECSQLCIPLWKSSYLSSCLSHYL